MFINEIVWCFSGGANTPRFIPRKHDIIYWYGYNNIYNKQYKPYVDKTDKRKTQSRGKIIEDWWIDIPGPQTTTKTKSSYPTEKPYKLLQRIICLSTK